MQEDLSKRERQREDWSSLGATLNNLAAAYREKGAIQKAEQLYKESGQIAERLGAADCMLHLQNQGAIAGL